MEAWNSSFATVNGVRLHYIREGLGDELIIFLHGWPEFWFCWRHQLKAFQTQYTVVAPDLRGFNKSDKPKAVSEYTQDVVAQDVVELISHLGFEKAIVVGHDWGGAVAWNVALNHPEVVSRFIVMNCPHPGIFINNLKSNPRQLLRSWYMFFFQLPWIPEQVMGYNLKQFFTKALKGMAHNKQNFPPETIARYVEAYEQPGALTGGFNYYRANIRAVRKSMPSKGRKVKVPTLIIWGANDSALGRELALGHEKYVDAPLTLEYIEDCSHWVQNDHPEEVNKLIRSFLAQS